MTQHEHRHLTTEQLSAFLDRQLSAQEETEYTAHLHTCQRCSQALADLKQTVALLHALPQPALPRSFVLSTSQLASATPEPVAQTPEERRQHLHAIPTTTRRVRRHRAGYVARQSIRALSTLAAVIGLVFFLSGVFVSLPHGGSTASNGSVAAPESQPATEGPKISSHPTPPATACNHPVPPTGPCNSRTPQTATPNHQPTQGATGSGTPQVGPPKSPSTSSALDLNSPQVHLGVGVVLLLIGILGVVLTRKRRE